VIHIEIIGLDPPCAQCTALLENARAAVRVLDLDAVVEKQWTLSEAVRKKYGLLLSPALANNGVVVAQGKVYQTERILNILKGE